MKNLKFTATLRSPLIAYGYLTFDGLLAAALFDRCGEIEEAHASVPIRCTDGLFHASAAIVDPISHGNTSLAASLRADHDLDANLFERNKQGRTYRKIGRKRRRDMGNVLSSYTTINTRTISWICTGNLARIENLLPDLCFIGKKRASGFGEVAKWDVDENVTDLDPLVDESGAPRRPIPKAMFTGDRNLPLQDVSWRPAYWDLANRATCYAPKCLSGIPNERV